MSEASTMMEPVSTPAPAEPSRPMPLLGRTVAVTASRRAEEQCTYLSQRGAIVRHAPAIHMIPIIEDSVVRGATEQLLAEPADIAVLTTAAGVRWWLQACEDWGMEEQVLAHLGTIPIFSRGPKTTGAIRAAGLRELASAASEASPELLEMLLAHGVAGKTVCVQVQGAGSGWNPMAVLLDGLRDAGATVIEIQVYRWELPDDLTPLDALVRSIAAREVDAVTFTAAPAVIAVLERAAHLGLTDQFRAALDGPVAALCVGPVTAAPLAGAGIRYTSPERMRLGALLKHAVSELTPAPPLAVAGHDVQVYAAAAVVDAEVRELTPPLAVLMGALVAAGEDGVDDDDLAALIHPTITGRPNPGSSRSGIEALVEELASSLGIEAPVGRSASGRWVLNQG